MAAVAARLAIRSATTSADCATVRISSGVKPSAAASPFRVSSQTPLSARIFRSPAELSSVSVESLLSYHTATPSAVLTSMLSVASRGQGWSIGGIIKSSKIETRLQLSSLGILGMKLCLVRMAESVPLPCAFSFRSSLHSGEKTEFEATKNPRSMNYEPVITLESGIGAKGQPTLENDIGGNFRSMVLPRKRVNTRLPLENEAGSTPMSMNYYQKLLQGDSIDGGPPLLQPDAGVGSMDGVQGVFRSRGNGPREFYYQQPQLESNADIVHIKLMRNNSYVTLTDHKGNRKKSVSAGQVAAKGDKPGRYSGEAAAEYMGRVVKQMKIRSVVVKVSGFTFFRRKKDAILAFKDGYTHSRGDVNPVVYIEDTTRKPHNGCRLPKSRRI